MSVIAPQDPPTTFPGGLSPILLILALWFFLKR